MLMQTRTWSNLKNTLSERSKSQNTTYDSIGMKYSE